MGQWVGDYKFKPLFSGKKTKKSLGKKKTENYNENKFEIKPMECKKYLNKVLKNQGKKY